MWTPLVHAGTGLISTGGVRRRCPVVRRGREFPRLEQVKRSPGRASCQSGKVRKRPCLHLIFRSVALRLPYIDSRARIGRPSSALVLLCIYGSAWCRRIRRSPSSESEKSELAYEAAVRVLSMQDASLSNLRNRATGLLGTAALAASFSAGLGLIQTDKTKGPVFPHWAAFSLLAVFFLLGASSIAVLWPVSGWAYAPSPSLILQRPSKCDGTAIRMATTRDLLPCIKRQSRVIICRSRWYRVSAILLVVELVIIVIGVATR